MLKVIFASLFKIVNIKTYYSDMKNLIQNKKAKNSWIKYQPDTW